VICKLGRNSASEWNSSIPSLPNNPIDREQENVYSRGTERFFAQVPFVKASSTGSTLRKTLLIFGSIYNTTAKEKSYVLGWGRGEGHAVA
jgi:hypothetical protein